MAKNKTGRGLAIFAIILGLIGSGTGGYLFAKEFLFEQQEEEQILPKARVYLDTSMSKYSRTTQQDLNFDQISYDTHNAFNLTSDKYVIPEDGVYHVDAQYSISVAETDDNYVIYIILNSQMHVYKRVTCSYNINNFCVSASDMLNCSVGDAISIRIYVTTSPDAWRTVEGREYLTFFAIAKLA